MRLFYLQVEEVRMDLMELWKLQRILNMKLIEKYENKYENKTSKL